MDLTDPKNVRRLNRLTQTQDAKEQMVASASERFASRPLQLSVQDVLTLLENNPGQMTDFKFSIDMLNKIKDALLLGLPDAPNGEKQTVRKWLESREDGEGLPMAQWPALPIAAKLANGEQFISSKNIQRFENNIQALALGVAHGVKDPYVKDHMHPKAYEWFMEQIPRECMESMTEGQCERWFIWHGHRKACTHSGLEEGVWVAQGAEEFPNHLPTGMKTNFFRDTFSCVVWF